MNRISDAASANKLAQMFVEIHFYFICWDTIYKMLRILKSHSGFRSSLMCELKQARNDPRRLIILDTD